MTAQVSLIMPFFFLECAHVSRTVQETVKDGNILRGWDGYLGKQASSGAIRRINRFREADRMFSASSVTSGQASTFTAGQSSTKVRLNAPLHARPPAVFFTTTPASLVAQGTGASSSGAGSGGGAKVKKGPTGARKRGRDDPEG